MSKLTIGLVAAGAALATVAGAAALVGSSHDTAGQATVSLTSGDLVAATPTPSGVHVTPTKAPPLVLPVPAPKTATLSPDPNSAACRANPATPGCGVNSVRYVVKGTTQSAHSLWLPVLTTWGLTSDLDTCIDRPVQAGILCLLEGVHSGTKVTLLFKAIYDGQYSPANVKVQTDAIHAKAMAAVQKLTSAPEKAKILQAAAAKIVALQTKANDWNAAHPMTSINVMAEQQ
jgi:hypothetical protein